MHISARWFAGFALVGSIFTLAQPATGQPEKVLPPTTRAPRLVLANARPYAPVMALAFTPDGSALYVAGYDKQLRRYALVGGNFVADWTFRVPIGPGVGGVLNAVAVSPDGKWVAVAGRAPIRGEVWVGAEDGILEDYRFDPEDVRGDAGIVYLFDPNNPNGGKVIRGQLSEVRAMCFANPAPADGPVLVTTGIERNEKGAEIGTMRVFRAETGKLLAKRFDLPTSTIVPALAAWATGPGNKELRVGLAWDKGDDKPGQLLVWNPSGPAGADTTRIDDRAYNSTLALRLGKDGAVAELITGGFDFKKGGGLTVRRADGNAKAEIAVAGKKEDAYLPLGVSALSAGGNDALAVLSRIVPRAGGARRHELRLTAPGAEPVALEGLDEGRNPVLAASPDGRFLAVGGFHDNRVEIFNVDALAGGKGRLRQELAGAEGGFSRVAFLAGEKLWLGKPTDTLEKGGVILDLAAKVRTARPRGMNEKLDLDGPDGPKPKIVPGDLAKKQPWRVVAMVDGAEKTITLPDGEIATEVAFLPAKPKWDPELGSLVAVAHRHERSQEVRLTLYNPLDSKPLYRLGGPTLPVRSLAFSTARPLLAGAGDDGTIAVWSLKNIARSVAAIEGLLVTTRENKVVVASVTENSPAKGKLAPGDVIDSVVDGKGNVRPVTMGPEFVLAVRTLKVGAEAKIAVGKRAVSVPVGTATGFRLPLFDLWVDPVANAGKHAWVGWTTSGPYDASGADAETRIGWLTATGDPARPAALAGAEQYRKLFYWHDFIRRLLETGDYNIAYVPPNPPKLRVGFTGSQPLANGKLVTREKTSATVTLDDPDRARDISLSELRWQFIGPDGATEWFRVAFSGGQAELALADRVWKRGTYTVRAKLFALADLPVDAVPLVEAAETVELVPPEPEFVLSIDGKPMTPGGILTVEKDAVEVAVAVDPKSDPANVVVKLSWTGAEPIELVRNAVGTFGPQKIDLKGDDTVIRVTATNRAAGPSTAALESRAVEVLVRKPAKIPPPVVKLDVLTAHDFRPTVTEPYVVSTKKVVVRASIVDANPITAIEWKIGNRGWEAGRLEPDPTDPTSRSQTLAIDLAGFLKDGIDTKDADNTVEVSVRATAEIDRTATQTLVVRYDGLPDVSVTLPQTLVTAPELNLSGGLKVTSKRRVAVRVLVTSPRTGQTREFDPTINKEQTAWDAGITLFPGDNQLGYVVRYDDNRKELRRAGLVEVRYERPPVVLGQSQLEIGTGTSGTLSLVVASAAERPPEVLGKDGSVGARTSKKPVRVFGASLWMVTATGVRANPGDKRLEPVSVVIHNGERASAALPVAVRGDPVRVEVAPPTIVLTYPGGTIAHKAQLAPASDPNFAFQVHVKSAARLTRVNVWYGPAPEAPLEQVSGVSAANAVAVGGGFELNARVALRLAPGARNFIKVEAAGSGEPVLHAFTATYTPPPVEVVIDSIEEPNKPAIGVSPGNAHTLQVARGEVVVRGHVRWQDSSDPIAKDPHLSVVFVANGVSHLPVAVSAVLPGEGGMRRFVGRVYLNSPRLNAKGLGETRVFALLRSGRRAVPQVGAERAALTVTSTAPFTRQRLHVLMLGVEVSEEKQGELVRSVIRSIGGEIPANNPNFLHGEFKRPNFESARMYPPQLDYTGAGNLNYLLERVQANIAERNKNPADAWVNDVVLLYYQGADWKDAKSGRWLLHTATTLSGAGGANMAEHAIRPDDLPPIPGMMVALVNVTGAEMTGDPLALDLPYLRYAWPDSKGVGTLLVAVESAVKKQRTVEEMRKSVDTDLNDVLDRARRIGVLPDVVLARVVGLKKP